MAACRVHDAGLSMKGQTLLRTSSQAWSVTMQRAALLRYHRKPLARRTLRTRPSSGRRALLCGASSRSKA